MTGGLPLIAAVLVPLLMLVFHVLSGFEKAEKLVNGAAQLDEETIRKYLAWNLPLHLFYTLLYALSALFLFTLFQ